MALTKSIPVRFTPEELTRMDNAAAKLGSDRSKLIRMCVIVFLEDFEARGIACLPLNWKAIVERLDGRTAAAKAGFNPDGTYARAPHPQTLGTKDVVSFAQDSPSAAIQAELDRQTQAEIKSVLKRRRGKSGQ